MLRLPSVDEKPATTFALEDVQYFRPGAANGRLLAMKGAFIVSAEEVLYTQIERVLIAHGGTAGDDVAQDSGTDGTLFTVYGNLGSEFEYDLDEEPEEIKGDVNDLPEFSTSTSRWAECRSTERFVEWVQTVAAARSRATWVLDGNGVLWSSARLDPALLTL